MSAFRLERSERCVALAQRAWLGYAGLHVFVLAVLLSAPSGMPMLAWWGALGALLALTWRWLAAVGALTPRWHAGFGAALVLWLASLTPGLAPVELPFELYVFYPFALLFFVARAVGRVEPPPPAA